MKCCHSGLKILRCCDHCDIVGVIKGEKKFKGAHWHCYRCRNGFNRRDEAIKHYKTHFRNPQTTFQISITQVGCSHLGSCVHLASCFSRTRKGMTVLEHKVKYWIYYVLCYYVTWSPLWAKLILTIKTRLLFFLNLNKWKVFCCFFKGDFQH